MKKKRYVLALLLCLVANSCSSRKESDFSGNIGNEWQSVAVVDGLDAITHCHVESLLKSHGIDSYTEGSVAYGLFVQRKNVVQTIAIIEKDLQIRKYDIVLGNRNASIHFGIHDSDWRKVVPNESLTQFLQQKTFGPETTLGRLLRSAEVQKEVQTFSYVVEMKFLEREYLETPTTLNQGYEVSIDLAVSPNEKIGGKRLFFQVWGNGKQIQAMGSNEWWSGNPEEVLGYRKLYDQRESMINTRK